MRRILQIITKSELGGAQSHVADLLEGFGVPQTNLDNRDNSANSDNPASSDNPANSDNKLSEFIGCCEMHLATGTEGPLTARAREVGAKVHILPRLQRSVNPVVDLEAVRECARLIRRIKPDIVHAHSSKAGVVARLAGRRTGVPVVFTAHGWGFSPGTPPARRALAWAVEAFVAPLGARIICVSESDRQLALSRRVGTSEKLVTVRYGIPPQSDQAQPATSPPRLIMVARFNEQKDQATLLHALSLLERDGKERDFHVDLVGSGPDFSKLQTLARELNLLNRVSFLGDRHDVPQLLTGSQVFILSTHYEGLPISIMEAMRAGLPVVATDVSGIKEEVEHQQTGFLTPHLDAPALARALDALIQDAPRRKAMGLAARQKFEQEFTRDRMLRQIEELYRELARRNAINSC